MVPCNSDGVVIFGRVFAWGVCALFGQEHLPDAYFWLAWCIFRRHVDFQDILSRKRGFVTTLSTKSQTAWNHDFRRGRDPGRTFRCRERSKKNTIWLLESTRFTETLKVFDQGSFSAWKEEQERRLIWCRFSSSLHLRAKSQRAQHIICNINLDDFFEPCAPTATSVIGGLGAPWRQPSCLFVCLFICFF